MLGEGKARPESLAQVRSVKTAWFCNHLKDTLKRYLRQ